MCQFGNMLERCLEICRRKILMKQVHRGHIDVEDAEMCRDGHERAIEVFSIIDVAANDFRCEGSGIKEVQREADEEIAKIRRKLEVVKEDREENRRIQNKRDASGVMTDNSIPSDEEEIMTDVSKLKGDTSRTEAKEENA